MSQCLYCYRPTGQEETDFHSSCSKQFFGQPDPPFLPYSESDLEPLALDVIQAQTALTGVQPKLSLHLTKSYREGNRKRFTIVGLWGGYILKPQTPAYLHLPEVEDLTMHLAQLANIKTAPHSLIRMASGNLAYITKRLDRYKKNKLAMEDMCQLTERLTEHKYQGSYKQVAKAIQKYSAVPGLDVVNFFELVLFSFLTGNADMHLKNFSLLDQPGLGMILSPAYDLVNTALVNPADDEEMALTLNGKKKKLSRTDFVQAMQTADLEEKQQENIFRKMEIAFPDWLSMIDASFLPEPLKAQYKTILQSRMQQIY
ncbi:MAG: HipA domain-containing protein [Lewinellaceae bacterium]|nr:HipA domain-containing protein [Lewinellaceae bacterium]